LSLQPLLLPDTLVITVGAAADLLRASAAVNSVDVARAHVSWIRRQIDGPQWVPGQDVVAGGHG
jgi:hypothetical protein